MKNHMLGSLSQSAGIDKLHMEISYFFNFISPMSFEETMRKRVVEKLASVMMKKFPRINICGFGSYATGLYLPTSDIDVSMDGDLPEDKYETIQNLLVKEGLSDSDNIIMLKNAKVPLIKYKDKETGVCVDISFNNYAGHGAILYVKKKLSIYPNIAPLFYFIRSLLLQNGLGEVFYGGLSSYSLFLMLVFFFQKHPRRVAKQPIVHLGRLLLDFFVFYGLNFDYSLLVIRVDQYNERYEFKQNSGHHFHDYPCILEVYDPNDRNNNVAKGTYRIMEIKDLFRNSFYKLTISAYEFIRKNRSEKTYSQQDRFIIRNVLNTEGLAENRRKIYHAHQALIPPTICVKANMEVEKSTIVIPPSQPKYNGESLMNGISKPSSNDSSKPDEFREWKCPS